MTDYNEKKIKRLILSSDFSQNPTLKKRLLSKLIIYLRNQNNQELDDDVLDGVVAAANSKIYGINNKEGT